MNGTFEFLDYLIFGLYAVTILAIGLWVSRDKDGKQKNAEDYFLASKSLPWWAVGTSLIAANISAEQFIGMSGSGFALGLAIASYEWMAAITLLVVGKYFLPIFIEKGLYTIPEFIEKRFSTNLKTILAIFWIALFVFVNLTTVLFLGGKALDTIIGVGDGSILLNSIIGLGLFAAAYSLWGGLASVAWTDVIQVVILIFGGLLMTYFALANVTDSGSFIDGMKYVYEKAPERFSMILSKGEIIKPNGGDAWWDLPGLAVLIGGIWVANLYYWGFNQYIIQRTLAAKSLAEGQKGIVFAAFLKLIIPVIVVLPGIIAYVMNLDDSGVLTAASVDPGFIGAAGNIANDNAAPWLIKNFIPVGVKGLILAALAAAIVSSLASMLNSTSTIFTMDIYRSHFNKNATDSQMVSVGRITAVVALIIAIIIAPQLGSLGQVFIFIQEYTGVVSPGILAVFLMGLFYKKATNNAAIWGAILSIPIAMYFKVAPKGWSDASIFVELPFMHQMGYTCLVTLALIALISYLDGNKDDSKGINLTKKLFATNNTFNIGAFSVVLITAFLYAMFW
ncbi:sodium/sugar symporter [Flavobacteriaceae bacterium]|jgi:SSS family solute:Na+ symporter|nr:sodium/sugar symporter [Flavobacteriaceae bacterium]MDA9818693.1 sodium/sugar symporter [Flavobacteriaceae bacterium]MDA9883187.1 sodium/sugar symporter [Flavobacteriaceae bacterium]MDC1009910.1 sodium/sugar symporter [Flavobacteriaceae bacterium]MDC3219218.1 sodium/sugar symporter [Flavobacteriaceae bacterium]